MKKLLILVACLYTTSVAYGQISLSSTNPVTFRSVLPLVIEHISGRRIDPQGQMQYSTTYDSGATIISTKFDKTSPDYRFSSTDTSVVYTTITQLRIQSLSVTLDPVLKLARVTYFDSDGVVTSTNQSGDLVRVSWRDMPYSLTSGVIVILPAPADSLVARTQAFYQVHDFKGMFDDIYLSQPTNSPFAQLASGVVELEVGGSIVSSVPRPVEGRDASASLSIISTQGVLQFTLSGTEQDLPLTIVSEAGQELYHTVIPPHNSLLPIAVPAIGRGLRFIRYGNNVARALIY